MIAALELVPWPCELAVREDDAGVHARLAFPAPAPDTLDVQRILEAELRATFGAAGDDLVWSLTTSRRADADGLVVLELFVPKVPELTPLAPTIFAT